MTSPGWWVDLTLTSPDFWPLNFRAGETEVGEQKEPILPSSGCYYIRGPQKSYCSFEDNVKVKFPLGFYCIKTKIKTKTFDGFKIKAFIWYSSLLKKINSNDSLNLSKSIKFFDHIFHFQLHISQLEKMQIKQGQTKIWFYTLRMAFILNVNGSFVFCNCLFLFLCFFISISLVDKGGTEAQGCVTTVSWHGVWS